MRWPCLLQEDADYNTAAVKYNEFRVIGDSLRAVAPAARRVGLRGAIFV